MRQWESLAAAAGSSPLARGLQIFHRLISEGNRIIPARAGFTSCHGGRGSAFGDHPRSRGVYPGVPPIISPFSGSSPLARGLRVQERAPENILGIIPARAGFTPCIQVRSGFRGDHPRSRGVYGRQMFPEYVKVGSSPLARGLRAHACEHGDAHRIIPARAGFTSDHAHGAIGNRDHPRSRGVYSALESSIPMRKGSSPLARGLPPGKELLNVFRRIIPARAGFTPYP